MSPTFEVSALCAGDTYQSVQKHGIWSEVSIETVVVTKSTDATLWWKYEGGAKEFCCRRQTAARSMPTPASEELLASTRARLRAEQLRSFIANALPTASVKTLEAVWAAFREES